MSAHNSVTGSTKELTKVGDKIRILRTCSITEQMYPELVGMVVEVDHIVDAGPSFVYEKPLPRGSQHTRLSAKYLQVSASDGWVFETVK